MTDLSPSDNERWNFQRQRRAVIVRDESAHPFRRYRWSVEERSYGDWKWVASGRAFWFRWAKRRAARVVTKAEAFYRHERYEALSVHSYSTKPISNGPPQGYPEPVQPTLIGER